jgi:hypothetical protein
LIVSCLLLLLHSVDGTWSIKALAFPGGKHLRRINLPDASSVLWSLWAWVAQWQKQLYPDPV